jgi:5-methylcytosine-specific restriction enzyme subunit McrC
MLIAFIADSGHLRRCVVHTDITLRHPRRTIIVDAKFYRKPLAQSLYGERVRSQHLYQLVTYLQHERLRQEDKGLSGMLIYPDVGQSLRLRYRLLGSRTNKS